MSLNRVILIGRLTRDPDVKTTQSGVSLAQFAIAVDRARTNPQSGQKEADFFRVKAWRQSAEYVANYLAKGRLVAVEGRIQEDSWVDQDGTKKYRVEIVADRVQRGSVAPGRLAASADGHPVPELSGPRPCLP